MNTDKNLIKNYLTTTYGSLQTGNIAVVEIEQGKIGARHTIYPIAELSAAVDHLASQRTGTNIYVGTCLHDDVALETQTRSADTASALTHMVQDADAAFGSHAAENLPQSLEEILGLNRKAGLPPPNQIVASGGGYYPQWQLTEPFLISSPSDRERAAKLSRAWHRKANKAWLAAGLRLDNVSDLGRVFRVPGGLNWKQAEPKLVVYSQEDNGERWTFEELEAIVADELAELDCPTQAAGTSNASLRSFLKAESFNADTARDRKSAKGALAALEACDFLSFCDENAECLPEPSWKDAADLLAHFPNGDRSFHELSKRDPRYSPYETQEKLDRAKQFAPKLCKTIAQNHPGCADCLFMKAGNIRTPATLSYSQPGLARLQKRYVLDGNTGLFYDIYRNASVTPHTFDRLFTREMTEKRLASTAFRDSKVSVIVSEMDYLPGNNDLITIDGDGENASRRLNTYVDSGIPAASGDASIWIEHLEYMLPDLAERTWFTGYLAHLVQHPGEKIRSAALLTSSQGVGKTSLIHAMARMLGEANVQTQFGSILVDRWQAGLGNSVLTNLDELDVTELKPAYNNLKRIVSEERFWVERKGIDAYQVRTPRGIIITSNNQRAINIESDDRRLFVADIDVQKRDSAYYKRLHEDGMTDEVIAAFRYYLERFDISNFNPNAAPPMTAAKQRLIASSRSQPEQLIIEMREDGVPPFHRDVYFAQDVATALSERMRRPITVQAVTPILDRIGDIKLERKLPIPGGSPRSLWIFRNRERWLPASNEELRQALLGQLPSTPLRLLPNPNQSLNNGTAP